ncbi:hypothetical protein LUZ60_002930 [Juncus effusus]|nr:hypothetical protein LUZ60_002930 [Juncus effusus]
MSSTELCITTEESGQTSKVVPMNDTFYCNICMENVPILSAFAIKTCSHKFCDICVYQHLTTKIIENVTDIHCPDPTCKTGIFEPEMCQEILGPDMFDRWCVILCEALIGSKKFYCPHEECSALLIDERNQCNIETQVNRKSRFFMDLSCFCPVKKSKEIPEITMSQCPHCYRLFCAHCKVPWHEGLSCEEYKDEKSRDDYLNLQRLATERKWKRCPHCSFYIEKTTGCRKISCRCGNAFCYVCGSTMSRVGHKCSKCNWEL